MMDNLFKKIANSVKTSRPKVSILAKWEHQGNGVYKCEVMIPDAEVVEIKWTNK